MKQKRNVRDTLFKLFKYMDVYRYKLVFSLVLGFIAIICNVISPRILSDVINEFYKGAMSAFEGASINIDGGYVLKLVFLMAGLYLLGSVLLYIQGFIMAKISTGITYELRNKMHEKIDKLPISYFDQQTSGEILSRLTTDVFVMTSMLSFVVTQIFTSILTIVGIVIMMYTMNWICATVAVVVVPTNYFVLEFVVKKSQKFFDAQQKHIGEVNGCVEEVFSQHNIVKAFNAEDSSFKKFSVINNNLYKSAYKAMFFSMLLMPIMFFISNINYLLVVIVGYFLVAAGALSVGVISAFIHYVKSLNQPMTQVANMTSVFQKIIASAQRVFEFLEEKEEDPEYNTIKLPEKLNGDIEFKNVCFSYNSDQVVLDNISFSVKAGQKVALVGETGSGKTTIVKLLMRFYEINSGQISIDGIDISKVKKSELRKKFSMVLQDTWMYSASIADNIRYGKLDASSEEVKKAAEMACVDRFINTLPKGYDTLIDDGASNISQGEKQLLTIARAIINNSQILILDEATSCVDIKTEVRIQKAMDNLTKGKTSFIIAHRLSTIKNADVIIVIQKGRIVEIGSHSKLLELGGAYANMYNSQFQI